MSDLKVHLASRRYPRRDQTAETCWADLAGEDATRAYAAVWGLADVPGQAVPLIRARLKPTEVPAELRPADLRPRVFLARVDGHRLVGVPHRFERLEVQAAPGIVVRPEEREQGWVRQRCGLA